MKEMDVEKRMEIIRVMEKIENNIKYSERIGIKNKSSFTPINKIGDKEFRC